MARRTGWNKLSEPQRKRLEGAGRSGKLSGAPLTEAETRKYWQSGGDLRRGYGHAPRPPRSAAPRDATERFGVNLPGPGDYERLTAWQRSGDVPAWLRDHDGPMGFETAALLSQFPHPRTWKSVQFTGTQPTAMTVTFKGRAYPKTVFLPDNQVLAEVGARIEQFQYPGLAVEADGTSTDLRR